MTRRGCADRAKHGGVQLIYVLSSERVDGNVTDGWDNVVLHVQVVCTPCLRTPCISPQRQPLGEPIAHGGVAVEVRAISRRSRVRSLASLNRGSKRCLTVRRV